MFGSMGGFGLMGFDEDPFSSSRRMFSQMDNMMNSMMGGQMGMGDPFGDPFYQSRHSRATHPAIMGPAPVQHQSRQPVGSRAMVQMDPSRQPVGSRAMVQMDPFSNMMSAMENVNRQGSCQSFSSSSVMTMRTGPDGKPQVYQSSTSSHGGPGGVKETHRTITDSSTGMRKMAIGRHIGDRAYVKEKQINAQGELEENDEFVNLDEEEVADFDSEFKQRSQPPPRPFAGHNALDYRNYSSPARQRSTYLPALPSSSRNDEGSRHRQKEKSVRKERNQ